MPNSEWNVDVQASDVLQLVFHTVLCSLVKARPSWSAYCVHSMYAWVTRYCVREHPICCVVVHRAKTSKPKKDGGDPGDGIMSMLRNLYDEGDDDMKRTLAKAWTEVQEKRKKGGDDDVDLPKL